MQDMLSKISPNADYTVFFVDDIVWKEPFTIKCNEVKVLEEDLEVLCILLRLDPTLTYCYAFDMDMNTPGFDEIMRWNCRGKDGDYGYPMSLDGHIFRTKEIELLLTKLSYDSPNSLEGALSKHTLKHVKMICLYMAPIFNMPINKVQTQSANRYEKYLQNT